MNEPIRKHRNPNPKNRFTAWLTESKDYKTHGINAKKRERRAYRKTFTRKQWNELKAANRRSIRRETGGAFGGEKKMRKLA